MQAWNRAESLRLMRRCLGAIPDACWHLTGQEALQGRLRECARSPWICLGGLSVMCLLVAAITGGLPAARNIVGLTSNKSLDRVQFIWIHPEVGGGDEGLPPDVVPAWATRSHSLEAIAPFVTSHLAVRAQNGETAQPLIVRTQASFFGVLQVDSQMDSKSGRLTGDHGLVLTNNLARLLFSPSAKAVGARVRVGREWYTVTGILPASFQFLSRQPTAYLLQPSVTDAQVMVVARSKPGVSRKDLDAELTRIAQSACYYFFKKQLHYSLVREAAWTPLGVFAVAALASGLLVLALSGASWRRLVKLLKTRDRKLQARRAFFFSAKVGLAFLLVFLGGLEWSRSKSAILFGSKDPAAGPFLLWLFILGTMGVLFWAISDQRARCRVCLRLLCFPVRVGCPGCLLLNWSGTELLCSEGHGLLHVPHMAPSWDEQAEHWIALDESWQELFAETKSSG
jgi:hypothetical protein